jgi:hypothetical protein
VEELNSLAQEEPGWLSKDGLRLYYARAEGRKKQKDILLAKRTKRDPTAQWRAVSSEELKIINTVEYTEGMPSLTADECEIYFHSDRPERAGKRDLWVATRSSPLSPWGSPRNLDEINSRADERQPSISSDGLTLWWTKTNGGEIWQATRANRKSRFGQAHLVKPPVNSYAWEGHFEVSPEWPAPGAQAYFVRNCSEVKGQFQTDILVVTWNAATDKSPRRVDDSGVSEEQANSD